MLKKGCHASFTASIDLIFSSTSSFVNRRTRPCNILSRRYYVFEYIRESTLILGIILFSFQFVVFYGLTKIFAVNHGLIPKSTNYSTLFQYFNLERGLVIGAALTLLGSVLLYTGFISELKIESTLKFIFPGIIAIALGIQIILFSFFFSILGLAEKK